MGFLGREFGPGQRRPQHNRRARPLFCHRCNGKQKGRTALADSACVWMEVRRYAATLRVGAGCSVEARVKPLSRAFFVT